MGELPEVPTPRSGLSKSRSRPAPHDEEHTDSSFKLFEGRVYVPLDRHLHLDQEFRKLQEALLVVQPQQQPGVLINSQASDDYEAIIASLRAENTLLQVNGRRLQAQLEAASLPEQEHALAFKQKLAEERLTVQRLKEKIRQRRHAPPQPRIRQPIQHAALGREQQDTAALVALADLFQQALRQFFDVHNQISTVSVVGLLVHYAVGQWWKALVHGDRQRIHLMQKNLHMIARKMQRFRGASVGGFEEACSYLEALLAQAPAPLPLERSPKGHVDHKGFQVMHKYVRDRIRVDLVPFMYDLDDEGRVHMIG